MRTLRVPYATERHDARYPSSSLSVNQLWSEIVAVLQWANEVEVALYDSRCGDLRRVSSLHLLPLEAFGHVFGINWQCGYRTRENSSNFTGTLIELSEVAFVEHGNSRPMRVRMKMSVFPLVRYSFCAFSSLSTRICFP